MTQLLSQNLPVRPIFLVVNDTIKFSSVIGGIVLVCFASMSILLGVEPKTLLTQVMGYSRRTIFNSYWLANGDGHNSNFKGRGSTH